MNMKLDASSPDEVSKAYDALASRAKNLSDLGSVEAWILDWQALSAAVSDRYSRAHVASTVDTTDPKAEAAYMVMVEKILPITETRGFELSKLLLAHPLSGKLGPFYTNFLRSMRQDVEIYREENVPLKTEEHKLVNEFEKIMGSFAPHFRGKEMTMQQVGRFLEDPDRATRKEAFEARAKVRRDHVAQLDDLYSRMLALRQKIAKNAGFKNFRDYQFAAFHRFDYTPKDCFDFHEAIEKTIVPIVSRFHRERKEALGVNSVRPWDILVDPGAKSPLEPFKKTEELVSKCQKIFHKVDPELGAFFDEMIKRKLLDLDSRKGKAPGGYCTSFAVERVPFIFMNAAGTRRDVDTLLHEGGHAFHYFLASHIKLEDYHHTGLEFAEVASMSMELLSRPHFNEFYSGETLQRVLSEQLKKILEFFPFMAMIDAFQHWVYTTDKNDAKARHAKWRELEKRFQPEIDWSGYEDLRDLGWQYPHVFSVPFYYVEYGIAQLGALAVWRQSLTDYSAAVRSYKEGLRLGGSQPLPQLFSAVGANFGLSEEIIRPLVKTVENALA